MAGKVFDRPARHARELQFIESEIAHRSEVLSSSPLVPVILPHINVHASIPQGYQIREGYRAYNLIAIHERETFVFRRI
jgi:hypothetical protein